MVNFFSVKIFAFEKKMQYTYTYNVRWRQNA